MRMAYLRARVAAGDRGSYPAALVAEVRSLYETGHTQRQIAARLGRSRGGIAYIMVLTEIPARPSVPPPHHFGREHPNWKGDAVTYARFHQRVVLVRGRPQQCEECGAADPRRWYDWANQTGRYQDPSDYRRLCRPCHRKFDKGRRQ